MSETIEGKTKILTPFTNVRYEENSDEFKNLLKISTKNVLTAYDAAKKTEVEVAEEKTIQNCEIFKLLTKNNIANSFVRQLDNSSFIARNCDMIPYECVIRRTAFGSYLKRNPQIKKGFKFGLSDRGVKGKPLYEFFHKYSYVKYDHFLHSDEEDKDFDWGLVPEDTARKKYMKDGEWILPVYTDPYAIFNWGDWREKNGNENDKTGFKMDLYSAKEEPTHKNKLCTIDSLITPYEYQIMIKLMFDTFILLEKSWEKFDVELVDLKIEMGKCKQTNEILVSDVIDNDSWRIWPNGDSQKQLDKQSFRDGESMDEVVRKYKVVTDYVKKFNK